VSLELQPVHDALRALLDPAIVRLFADLAEYPRNPAAGINQEIEAQRAEFFEQAWESCENFLRQAQETYISRAGNLAGGVRPANPALLGQTFRERLRAAMRIPAVEALFAIPWTVAARRMLPNPSPQLTATAMWGPVLAWCALELLAESIDSASPEGIALDLFDRLRLREPFAQAFAALGFEGEEGWRVAARIKVLLLTEAGVGKPEETLAATVPTAAEPAADTGESDAPALWPALWFDPDVRWLSGVHRAEGHDYLVRELYEELLWWLLMPSLLRLAGEAAPSRAAVETVSKTIEEALAEAEAAGYRVDLLAGLPAAEADSEETAPEAKPQAGCDVEPVPESEAAGEPGDIVTKAKLLPAEDGEAAEQKIEPEAEIEDHPVKPA
jgi:hypothetical protein